MPRIKINFPENTIYELSLAIRVSDLNYGAHVGNDNILTLMHEARIQYLVSLGYKDELSLGNDIGIIVSDVAISYKTEAFYGDKIKIVVAVDDFNRYGFDMYYRLINSSTDRTIAEGKTGIVCLNYSTRKIAEIPHALLQALTI